MWPCELCCLMLSAWSRPRWLTWSLPPHSPAVSGRWTGGGGQRPSTTGTPLVVISAPGRQPARRRAGLTSKPHHARQPRVALRGSFRLRLASTCNHRPTGVSALRLAPAVVTGPARSDGPAGVTVPGRGDAAGQQPPKRLWTSFRVASSCLLGALSLTRRQKRRKSTAFAPRSSSRAQKRLNCMQAPAPTALDRSRPHPATSRRSRSPPEPRALSTFTAFGPPRSTRVPGARRPAPARACAGARSDQRLHSRVGSDTGSNARRAAASAR